MSNVYAVMVTYRRPEHAKATSLALMEQTQRPSHIWVVDNDPASNLADYFASIAECTYLPQLSNLGPAGGIAVGMLAVSSLALDGDWVLLVDDDDPPPTSDVIERLLDQAYRSSASRLGGVALIGARYNHRTGIIRRVLDEELIGEVKADYFAGNQFPMYSVAAIRQSGFFDAELFFGFEELEFGLRLRENGWDLVFDGDRAFIQRKGAGRLGLPVRSPSLPNMPAWRRYYSARNSVVIAHRYGTLIALLRVVFASIVITPLRMLRDGYPVTEAVLPARGAIDGLFRRLGLRVEPRGK